MNNNYLRVFITSMLLIILSGCGSLQEAPKDLELFSPKVKATFVSYKHIAKAHKAFAVAKYNGRDFYAAAYSYRTVEKAREQALIKCYQVASEYEVKCFIYHSE